MLGFDTIRTRLLERVRQSIRNGETTERGLALKAGISQPHLHNILKGVRALNAASADLLLSKLGISSVDLFETAELRRALFLRAREAELSLEVPVLKDRLGPGLPWPRENSLFERVRVPVRFVSRMQKPVVARLVEDPEMVPVLDAGDLVLLDRSPGSLALNDPDALLVVRLGADVMLRWVRAGRARLYLVSAGSRNRPRDWRISQTPASETVLARAIPLRSMYPPELLYDPLLLPRDTPPVLARPSDAS